MNPLNLEKIDKNPTFEIKTSIEKEVKPKLLSPESKSSARLSAFLILNLKYPEDFPFISDDSDALERLRWVLGLPPLPGRSFAEEPYIIKNWRAQTWLNWVKEKIGFANVLNWYLVGSSATFVSGKNKLIECLQLLKADIPNDLFRDIHRKLEKWNGSFNDIDFKIQVEKSVDLKELAKQFNEDGRIEASYFSQNDSLLLRVKDDNGNGVDFYIYSTLLDNHALNTDNWCINLKNTVLQPPNNRDIVKEIILYESTHAWFWWLGQTFKVIVKKECTDRSPFERLVDRFVRSHLSLEGTELCFFEKWRSGEYQKNDDPSVRKLLQKLTIQQIAFKQVQGTTKQINYLVNQTSQVNAKYISNRFLKTIFKALNEKRTELAPFMHAIIECIAVVALCEGWDKPFSVKLVTHEKKPTMRMRIDGYDLLLKFNPEESLSNLPKKDSDMWNHLKRVLHSLWFDGIHLREVASTYKVNVNPNHILRIKQAFLHGVSPSRASEFIPVQQKSLAAFLIPLCEDADESFWLGIEVLEEYDQNSKQRLCWMAVENCLKYNRCDRAAELISRLREEEIEPENGYESFFMNCLRGNCSDSVLQACNPLGIQLNWLDLAKTDPKLRLHKLLQLIDDPKIPAEEYIKTVVLTKTKPKTVSEATLIKILNHVDPRIASEWIQKYDKREYQSEDYRKLVSTLILNPIAKLPPTWILVFLNSNKFIGDCSTICAFMLSQNIDTLDKANLLKKFEIQDKELWRQIAGEYLRKDGKWPKTFLEDSGIPSEILAHWCTVIVQILNPSVVVPLLNSMKDTHGLKGVVLIHLLKSWDKKRCIDPIVLTLLNPGKKLPWKEIVSGAESSKDILTKLKDYKKDAFNIYTSLMYGIYPKEDHYFTYWIDLLETYDMKEVLAFCKQRLFKDCLMMKPKQAMGFLKKITCPDMIRFVLEIANKKEYLDLELFSLLLIASFEVPDNGATTEYLFDCPYPKIQIHDDKLIQKIFTQAIELLKNPLGNLNAVAKLCKLLPEKNKFTFLAPSHRLRGLIRNKEVPLVIKMLHDSTDEDRRLIEPKLYCEILRTLETSENKIDLLSDCQVTSVTLKKIWEDLTVSPEVSRDIFSTLKLIPIGHHLGIEITTIQNIAINTLSRIGNQYVIKQDLIDSIYNLLEAIETKEKIKLWEALKNSERMPLEKLWKSGLDILICYESEPPLSVLRWLISNCNHGKPDALILLMPKLLPKLPDDLNQKYVNYFVKNEAVKGNSIARDLFWKHTKGTVLTNDEMDLLQPTDEQKLLIIIELLRKCESMTLIEKSKTLLNICERYSDCWLNDDKLLHHVRFILLSLAHLMKSEFEPKLLKYLILLLTNENDKDLLNKGTWNVLLKNFGNLSKVDIQMLRPLLQSEDFYEKTIFISYLIKSARVEYIDIASKSLKERGGVLDPRVFDAILNLESEQRNKFEEIIYSCEKDDYYKTLFRLFKLKDSGSFKCAVTASDYIICFHQVIVDDNNQWVNTFMPPILEYIFESKNTESLELLKQLFSGINGTQTRFIAIDKLLSKVNNHSEADIVKEIVSFICSTLEDELKSSLSKVEMQVFYNALESATLLVFSNDFLKKIKDRLHNIFIESLTQDANLSNIRPIYVVTRLLHNKFQFRITLVQELEFISYLVEQLISMRTRTAVDSLQFLMCDLTYQILYAHPAILNPSHMKLVQGTLDVYDSYESFLSVYKLLFKHLIMPCGNNVDVFLKGRDVNNVSLHQLRLKLIEDTIFKITKKHPQMLNVLINFIHNDLVHLYLEEDILIWEELAGFLFESCKTENSLAAYKSLALLLSTCPSQKVNRLFHKHLITQKDTEYAQIIENSLTDNSFLINQESKFYPFLAFSFHIRNCEALTKEFNPADVKLLDGIFTSLLKSIEFFKNAVVSSTSKKRLFLAIHEILNLIDPLIPQVPLQVNFYISKLIEYAPLSFNATQQAELGMAIAKIYRKELKPQQESLILLGGTTKCTHIFAEMTCQVLRFRVDAKDQPYPLELLKPFLEGNFDDYIKHNYHSSIYTSSESRSKFFAVYIAILKGIFEDLRTKRDQQQFMKQLILFRNLTDMFIQNFKSNFFVHLNELFLIFESNSSLLSELEISQYILDLAYFNLRQSISFHMAEDNIFEFLGRFSTLSFIYGPDPTGGMQPNKYHRLAINLTNKLALEIRKATKSLTLTDELRMYLETIQFIESKNFLTSSSKVAKASKSYLHLCLDKYHVEKFSEWFSAWKNILYQ